MSPTLAGLHCKRGVYAYIHTTVLAIYRICKLNERIRRYTRTFQICTRAKANSCSVDTWTPHYRIVGNFQGRKLSRIGEKHNFRVENFRGMLALPCQRTPCPQISRRKLLQIATKLRKLQGVFSLESFQYMVSNSMSVDLLNATVDHDREGQAAHRRYHQITHGS